MTLAEKWKDFPRSYLGLGADGFPNYFIYSGPYSPVAQGSLLPILTLLTRHIIKIVRKMRKQHIRRISPKASAVTDFIEHANTYFPRTCWADPCTSWFKQGTKSGPIVIWPGSRLAFFDVLKDPQWEDYDIEYWGVNRWSFLGNGFNKTEFDGMSDITWYLDEFSGVKEWENGFKFDDEREIVQGHRRPGTSNITGKMRKMLLQTPSQQGQNGGIAGA